MKAEQIIRTVVKQWIHTGCNASQEPADIDIDFLKHWCLLRFHSTYLVVELSGHGCLVYALELGFVTMYSLLLFSKQRLHNV